MVIYMIAVNPKFTILATVEHVERASDLAQTNLPAVDKIMMFMEVVDKPRDVYENLLHLTGIVLKIDGCDPILV